MSAPGKFQAPPRTVSSGAHVDESKLADFRRKPAGSPPPAFVARGQPGAGDTSRSPARSPMPERPTLTPSPGAEERDEDAAAAAGDRPLPSGVTQHYTPDRMAVLQSGAEELPEGIRDFFRNLYPEGSKPATLWSRENLFSDKERTLKDRKLANMVLGILGRLTPENYDVMKKELLELPIRQSTDEEITDVVKMMYTKAVRPEDELYTELYANLMADLVQHTGVQGVGKTIRKAIIDKCQAQFEEPFRLSDEDKVDAEGNPLPDEELSMKVQMLKARLRANIKFLGHLFISGMVNEKVVNFVLFTLLYGRDNERKQKRKPEEYELEMFCDLLKKVAKTLSQKTLTEYIPEYMKALDNIKDKVGKRIFFMLEDMKDLYNNGWQEKRRHVPKGPMKLEEFEKVEAETRAREMQEIERAAHQKPGGRFGGGGYGSGQPGSPVGQGSPKIPAPVRELNLPKKDEVYDTMERYTKEGAPTLLEDFFKPMPAKERAPYIVHWLCRIVKVNKKEDERKAVGQVFDALKQSNLLGASELENTLKDLGLRIVVETMYDEAPKLWVNWTDIVNSSKSIIPQSLHTFLLMALIRGGDVPTPVGELVKMVNTVLEAKDPNAAHRDYVRRFRPLPAILSFANPMPNPDIPEDELDELDVDTGDDDLLGAVVGGAQSEVDPEIAVFDNLFSSTTMSDLAHYITKHANRAEPLFAAKIVAAFFTYGRCDTTAGVFDKCREPLQELLRANPQNDVVFVVEAYMSYAALSKQPEPALRRFIDRLKLLELISQKSIESAARTIDPALTKDFNECFGLSRAPAAGGPGPAPMKRR